MTPWSYRTNHLPETAALPKCLRRGIHLRCTVICASRTTGQRWEFSLPHEVSCPSALTSAQQSIEKIEPHPLEDTSGKGVATAKQPSTINQGLVTVKARLAKQGLTIPWRELVSGLTWLFMPAKNQPWHTTSNLKIQRWTLELNIILMHSTSDLVISIFFQSLLKSIFMGWTFNYKTWCRILTFNLFHVWSMNIYSQTKWSVPLKIALMNLLFEIWTH